MVGNISNEMETKLLVSSSTWEESEIVASEKIVSVMMFFVKYSPRGVSQLWPPAFGQSGLKFGRGSVWPLYKKWLKRLPISP